MKKISITILALAAVCLGATRVVVPIAATGDDRDYFTNVSLEICSQLSDRDTITLGAIVQGVTYFGFEVRFASVAVPQNATVAGCTLVVKTWAASSGTPTISADVSWYQADNPTAPNSSCAFASPVWTYGDDSWGAAQIQRIDMGTGLNAIFSRSGWASGNAVILQVVDNGSDATIRFQGYSSFKDSLVIWYNDPVTGTYPARRLQIMKRSAADKNFPVLCRYEDIR